MAYETPTYDEFGAAFEAHVRHEPTNTGEGTAVTFTVNLADRGETTDQQVMDAFQALIDYIDAGSDFTVTEASRSYGAHQVVTLTP